MISRNPTNISSKTPFNYGYIVVGACFIITMMNVGLYLTMGVFFKPIAEDMGWTRGVTSLPIAVSTLVTAISTVVAGNLVDRFGPRRVALVYVLITAAGYFLMSRLNSLWELYLYFGLLIAIGSGLLAPFLSLIPRWFTRSRTVMAGIISAGGGVGGLFMPLVADWLITGYNWQRAYLIMGIVYSIVAIIAVQFLRRAPATIPVNPAPVQSKKAPAIEPAVHSFTLKEAVRSPNFVLMLIMVFSFGFIANTINMHSAPNATDIGFSSTAAAGLLSIMNGVSIFGCVALGAMGDRFGNQKMLLVTFLIEGAAMVWLAFIDQLWMMYAFMIIYGVVFGSGLAQISPQVARLFGTRSLGLILGVITFVQTVGSGLGVYVPGWLYDINKNYFMAYILCGILGAAAVIATLCLKFQKTSKQP